MQKHLILQTFVVCLVSPLLAQSPTEIQDRVDAVFAQYDRTNSPGCALGVIRDGEFIHKRGYGMANLEWGIALSARSVFRIGSTSKQFTAASVALLELEGKLSLDDEIQSFFPEIPRYPRPVTVRHLIHHTSGLCDYLTLMSLAGLRDDDFYTDAEVLEMLARQKEPNFPAGQEFLYSNSNYLLMAHLVERVSGQNLKDFAQEKIFDPLGMSQTHFHNDHTHLVPDRASGYRRSGKGFRISMTTLGMIGDGGVFTSVQDLLHWDRNFYNDRLGGGKLVESMLRRGRLANGEELRYAFALNLGTYRGLKTVRHGGAFVGFRAELLRFPEEQFSVICLCNLAQTNPSQLANQVADIYLADRLAEPAQKEEARRREQSSSEAPSALSGPRLREYLGEYLSEELAVTYFVKMEGGQLVVRVRSLPARSLVVGQGSTAQLGRPRLRFERDGEGALTGFRLDAGRVKNLRFSKRQ